MVLVSEKLIKHMQNHENKDVLVCTTCDKIIDKANELIHTFRYIYMRYYTWLRQTWRKTVAPGGGQQ